MAGNLARGSNVDSAAGTTPARQRFANYSGLTDRSLARTTSAEDPSAISPLMLGKYKETDAFNLDAAASFGVRLGRKSSLRRPVAMSPSLRAREAPSLHARDSPSIRPQEFPSQQLSDEASLSQEALRAVFDDIATWIRKERARKKISKTRRSISHVKLFDMQTHAQLDGQASSSRRASDASDSSSIALDRLADMVEDGMHLAEPEKPTPRCSAGDHRRSLIGKLKRQSTAGQASDTDVELETHVPTCEAILDNSKTLSYFGGVLTPGDDATVANQKNRKAWDNFKFEIVRLTHTLKLRGWRRVPMAQSSDIDVERLSGALTNAIYVVTPPQDIVQAHHTDPALRHKKPPLKLLLRIYGPQVEALIDREAELQILKRLSKKNIGPKLLGTFTNGRFEQFLHARALKPQDLRSAETSIQIAKRMRELHDGIELLVEERDAGPFVWRNWAKWVENCRSIVTKIDAEIVSSNSEKSSVNLSLKKRGLVCGTPWPFFEEAVNRVRTYLEQEYGNYDRLREELLFAHNDTQYGNILRIEPPGESPLLLPANRHKQLVVIDFEYACANTMGLEFANHFTEWCYNYHDPLEPFVCNTTLYPTPEEQHRFIKSYIHHQPAYVAPSAVNTPRFGPVITASPTLAPSTSISGLNLNRQVSVSSTSARSRASTSATTAEVGMSLANLSLTSISSAEDSAEINKIMHETRIWRASNSAQWAAWGIMQARVPGITPSSTLPTPTADVVPEAGTDPLDAQGRAMAEDFADRRPDENEGDVEGEDEEFDYLSYSRERALFFWGDVLQLGLVSEEELARHAPRGQAFIKEEVKFVGY